MQIITEQVRKGEHDGKEVWICHYNQPDVDKKPLRNVRPTKAIIVSNSELPKGKNVHYSKSHFRKVGKSGALTAQVISPVDNTGHRSNPGNEIYVFDSEAECFEAYKKQVMEAVYKVEFKIKTARVFWENTKSDLMDLIE